MQNRNGEMTAPRSRGTRVIEELAREYETLLARIARCRELGPDIRRQIACVENVGAQTQIRVNARPRG